ncbi:MAG: hypothetical protein FJ265_19085 [Planctomycetes bacterium]|nr:hypothetical protein [Planctomycetota bacterium]
MKHTTVLAALLVVAAACVSPETHRRVLNEKDNLQSQNAAMLESQKVLAVENERLRNEVADLGRRAADAAWIDEQKRKINELLEKQFGKGSLNAQNGIEVVSTPEGTAFRIAGGVLFASGRNEISEQGRRTLQELVRSLEGRRLRIDGHTDDQQIDKSSWGTNLRLSVERAMAVAEFLIQSAGVRAENVAVGGFGEYRPAAPGSDDASRQKNRRVEILMLER